LLKGLGICRVSKESTLSLYLYESFIPELVEVMGKSRIWNLKLFLDFSDDKPVRMGRQQQLHNAEPWLDAHG